jgi:pSer/pThr/pTyr-binding forkhead associated (FHA) protein
MARVLLHQLGPDSSGEQWAPDIVIGSFPFVVGRHPECSHTLSDRMVSRYHCSFFQQGEQVWVQDMNSRNGTYVNGQLAQLPHVLHDGDELRLAAQVFRVSLRASEADSSGLVRGGQASAAEAC